MFDQIIEKIDVLIRMKIEKELGIETFDFSKFDLFFTELGNLKENCMKVKINLEDYENLKRTEYEYKSGLDTSKLMQEAIEQHDSEIKKLNKKILYLEEDLRKEKSLTDIPVIEEYLVSFLETYNKITSSKINEFTSNLGELVKQHENNLLDRGLEFDEEKEKFFSEIKKKINSEFEEILHRNENIILVEEFLKKEIVKSKENIEKYYKYSINLRENSSEISSSLLETQKELDKVKKEKLETINSLEKQFIKSETENVELKRINALLLTKFNNARFMIKNIFNYYLDDTYQNDIESCFLDQDINLEEASNLQKKIRNSVHYNFSLNLLESLRLKIDDKSEVIKLMKLNLRPGNNCLQTMVKFMMKLIENDDMINNSELFNKSAYQSERVRNLEDTLKEKDETIMNFIKQNEELLRRTPRSSREVNVEQYLTLETENKKLKEQKDIIKKNTEEIIKKVKKNMVGNEYLVDKRIVGGLIFKILDKNTKKSIRLSILETLASMIGFENDERRKLGLKPISLERHSFYQTASTEKINEISDDLYNIILKD
jgi:hypothetical protein